MAFASACPCPTHASASHPLPTCVVQATGVRRSDFEIMTARLASDRQPDRLHHGGIPRVGTQDALEINRVGLPQAGMQHAGGRHAHAVAVLAKIVGQGRDEADLAAGLGHADVARRPAGPFSQIDQRPALLDQATQRRQRQKLIGAVRADFAKRHGFDQGQRSSRRYAQS